MCNHTRQDPNVYQIPHNGAQALYESQIIFLTKNFREPASPVFALRYAQTKTWLRPLNTPRNSAQALLLHLHKQQNRPEASSVRIVVLVEMRGIEPLSNDRFSIPFTHNSTS